MGKTLIVFGGMAVITILISVPVLYLMMKNDAAGKGEEESVATNVLSLRERSPIYEGGILLGLGGIPAVFLYMDFGILHHPELVKISLVFGLVPVFLLVWGLHTYYDRFKQNESGRVHGMILGTLGLVLAMYSLTGYANIFLDSQTIKTVRTKAIDKKEYAYDSAGSRSGPTYFYFLTVPMKSSDGQVKRKDIPVLGGDLNARN